MKSSRGFTLVELMVVVAVVGILAAIAIPAFLRYIKSSKAAEAGPVIKGFLTGAKAYYISEQRYTPVPNGAEPWHVPTATHRPGFPVRMDQQVFPGGNNLYFTTAIAGGDGWVSTWNAPQGGEKQIPFRDVQPTYYGITAALNKLNVNLEDPSYFAYSYSSAFTGLDAKAEVVANANFNPNDAEMHSVWAAVAVSETGEPIVTPAWTQYEFR